MEKKTTSGQALYMPDRQKLHAGCEHGTPASMATRSPTATAEKLASVSGAGLFTPIPTFHWLTPSPISTISPADSCPDPHFLMCGETSK